MKIRLLSLLISILSSTAYSQCFSPTTVFSSNINYYSADVNWNSTTGTHHYRIRFKEVGTTNWFYRTNIDSTQNSILLNNLLPQSYYIWQIRSQCDSLNITFAPQWSSIDTFFTNTNDFPEASNLNITNINYNNVIANWDNNNSAHHYRIEYSQIGTGLWSSLSMITLNSVTIPLLQQNTTYIWKVKTFYDSVLVQNSSLWSQIDTFTTSSFIAASFNPIITNNLSSLECNVSAELSLKITQTSNEPDIGTSIITSDGGYFDIGNLSIGDSVGYANLTTATQSMSSVLKAGFIAGQDYATINSYDSTGSFIGFFSIENDNGGIKVSSTTPNDGNNYTSGYISEIHFTNLFINPINAGPLYFYIDIESELNDQIYNTDTVNIWCNSTSINEIKNPREIINIFDVLGRKTTLKNNAITFIQYSDRRIEKKITLHK